MIVKTQLKQFLLLVSLFFFVLACGRTPVEVNTESEQDCELDGTDLDIDCVITGTLENNIFDLLEPANTDCTLLSYILFDQEFDTQVSVIYAQNGDDNDSRVRIGININEGAFNGQLGKRNNFDNCVTIFEPSHDVTANYVGRHVALVDKMERPMCVFSSQLALTDLNVEVELIEDLPIEISSLVQNNIEETLHLRMDLEVARIINTLLRGAEFEGEDGRCENDWVEFNGD